MKTIKNWNQFNESNIIYTEETLNEEMSILQKEYREYFRAMLDCYDVTSPSKLSEEKKKEFFNNINKYWTKGKGATKSLEEIKEDICGKKEKE